MIGEGIETNLAIAFAVQRRNFADWNRVALRRIRTTIQIHNLDSGRSGRPRLEPFFFEFRIRARFGSSLYRLRRQQPRGLVMPMSGVHVAKIIDHHVGTKGADHADHILENLIAPDSLGFLRRLRKSKVRRAREE